MMADMKTAVTPPLHLKDSRIKARGRGNVSDNMDKMFISLFTGFNSLVLQEDKNSNLLCVEVLQFSFQFYLI